MGTEASGLADGAVGRRLPDGDRGAWPAGCVTKVNKVATSGSRTTTSSFPIGGSGKSGATKKTEGVLMRKLGWPLRVPLGSPFGKGSHINTPRLSLVHVG